MDFIPTLFQDSSSLPGPIFHTTAADSTETTATSCSENTMTAPPKHQGSIDTEMTDGPLVAAAEPAMVRLTVEPGPPRFDCSHAAQLSAAQERINELQRQLKNEK